MRLRLAVPLMLPGTLKDVLLDARVELNWTMRLRMAGDIAKGVKYLHDQGTVHRDLKAENCFVDSGLRVKVADFGTGHIAAHIAGHHHDHPMTDSDALHHHHHHHRHHHEMDYPTLPRRGTSAPARTSSPLSPSSSPLPSAVEAWADGRNAGRTMSRGIGSLLWMAPELLRGSRVHAAQAPALDVYSYAIVLWEVSELYALLGVPPR
jgi:serine/threonine protein kinase